MNGRCDNDPLDRAENVCDNCGGDFCDSCLLYPRGKKRAPVCKACAIAKAGLRSSSKSQTSLERKNVRKRRKELQEQVEEHDDGAFVYFDEDGSDIVLRDRSVLLPPVDEEQQSGRRFGKKTKPAEAASDKASVSKPKDKPSKKKAAKKTEPIAEDDAAGTELPPPPSSADAVEDPDKTVNLDEALMGYSVDATNHDGHVADDATETMDTAADPFSVDASKAAPGSARSIINDKGAAAPNSQADQSAPSNDRPSASELLARLQEAEASREDEPLPQTPVAEPAATNDPWIPTAMAGGTPAAEHEEKVDVTVNPFASATPEHEPMDTWEPPSVTPEREPMDTWEPPSVAPEREPMDAWEPPSVTPASIAPSNAITNNDPMVDFLPYEAPGVSAAASIDSAPGQPEELLTFDDSASFTHDPAFESDDFGATEFGHDPGFTSDQHVNIEPVDIEPIDQLAELEPVGALGVPPQLESTFDALPELKAVPHEPAESGEVSPTKADTDDGGNWIPPALRGMAPKAERDADTLPKRRGADDA